MSDDQNSVGDGDEKTDGAPPPPPAEPEVAKAPVHSLDEAVKPPVQEARKHEPEIEEPPPKPPAPPEPRASMRGKMAQIALIVTGLVLVVALIVAIIRRPGAPSHARSIGARLDLAAGEVTVTEDGNAAKALSGTPLATGARVATGKGARALVRAGDGSAIFLRAESEIVLEAKGVMLERGEIWLDAPNVEGDAVEVKLGSHIVSAADAGLSIKRTGDDATVYVARGLAILSSPGGRVEIHAGEQGAVVAKDAPKVGAVAFWQDWTGGMADAHPTRGVGAGSGRIYGLDPMAPAGAPAVKLGIAKQSVRVVIRDGVAETEVDQTFSNPGSQNIEGWYWFTVPAEAVVSSFALETDGQLVEGEVVEKREAAAKYAAAVKAAVDPALLEWIDGRSYRAKIYPIPASGTRRVVLRYVEVLPSIEGKTRYVYPMRSSDPVRFDEFALSADLGESTAGRKVATSLDATLDAPGRVVSMRRSGYVPRADFQIEITGASTKPVRAWRFEPGPNQADYLMLRWVPDMDFAKMPAPKGEVVVVVDSSAGGDEAARQLRVAAAEGVLRALSDDDRFALVALDVTPTVVYPAQGLAQATAADIAKALEKLSDHGVGGATDLGAMFEPALGRVHGLEQPAIVYVGDGIATSGETSSDGLMERLRRSFSGSRARLFAVGVGPDAKHELLTQLARAGGGQYLRIDEADQTTGQALRLASAIKTPTITDLEVDLGAGLDQPFSSATGKLARGEELMLLARTHHALPKTVRIKGRAGGAAFSTDYPLEIEKTVVTGLVPRLWAAEYMRRLVGSGSTPDDNRAKILDLGLEYGLMTPYTSILALENEAAYARMSVKRRNSALRGIRLSSITSEAKEKEALGLLFPLSGAVAGCDKRSDSEPGMEEKSVASKSDDKDKSGGTGSRHKGAEGSMGDPSPAAAPTIADPTSVAATSTASPTPIAHDSDDGDYAKKKVKSDLDGVDEKKNEATKEEPPATIAKPLAQAPIKDATKPGYGAGGGLGGNTAMGPMGKKPDVAGKPIGGGGGGKGPIAAATATFAPPVFKGLPPPPKPLGHCSDAASRPLAERIVLWKKRIKQASTASELVSQYELARSSCELPDFRDQSALLDLLQQKVQTEDAAKTFLAHFVGNKDAQQFVARAILRRTVDVRLSAAVSRVLFGAIDWAKVDREILDTEKIDEKLTRLRAAMLIAPGDPEGDVRLVRLLAKKGDRQEALSYGRRLRDRGLLTPSLAQSLGDVLVEAGEKDEALRTYSEIVEFDGQSAISRRLLGDVFLRQGWHDAAYRQYKTLLDLQAKSPTSRLRLAAAAAGAGRVDEALRIEREVAAGEGSPGPDDPRQFARLWSASRLGTLLADPAFAADAGSIARKLKELQLFSGPGTLSLLSWDDLDARLVLAASQDSAETLLGERTDAGETGLYSILASSETWSKTSWAVRWRAEPPGGRSVKFRIVTLTWDGKAFSVKLSKGELKSGEKQSAL